MKTRKTIRLMLLMVFSLLLLLEASYGASAPSQANDGLAIQKVILYKHGVGYFERQGKVNGQSDVVLTFKKDQMNDLLKSLTALDLTGGQVSSIVYDSTKTVEQLLNQFSFKLFENSGRADLLLQLKGSQVELTIGSKTLRGTLLGIESRKITMNDETRLNRRLSLLEESGQMMSFGMDEIISVTFLDPQLQADVQQYLKILSQQHRKNEKRVVLRTAQAGERDLLVSYVTETPVWKATYRVVLPEEEKEKPFLQGWAIVDNVSEEDWENVQLSLVSGLPISFIQNLYDPWYKKRPVVAVSEEVALAPTTPEEGMALGRVMKLKKARMSARERFQEGKAEMEDRLASADAPASAMLGYDLNLAEKMRDLQTETVTREVGDLFEYQIDEPVTIARNQSAMIPIVAGNVEGETVALYNESVRSKNPLSAFRMRNSTGLTLEGGPLTVYQAGSYAGEALVKTVKADEQRYITYAVDLGLHVNTKHGSNTKPVTQVIIHHGTMSMKRGIIETKAYNLDNKDDREKVVVIEHPFHRDWKLLNQEKPIEVTDHFKRFEVNVAARERSKFEVKEMRDHWERLQVSNITPEQIEVFISRKYLSSQTHKALEKIVSLKAEIVKINRQLKALAKETESIFKDQKRLRDNLGRLGRSDEEKRLRSRYIEQLNSQEDRLAEMDKQAKQLQNQRVKLQKQLDDMIENLEQNLTL